LRKALDRQFNVGYVDTSPARTPSCPDKAGKPARIAYEYRKPFIYNIDFVVKFAHRAPGQQDRR
jgi:hypothetical protein